MAEDPLILDGLDNFDMAVESLSGEIGHILGSSHTHPGHFRVLWSDGVPHATTVYDLREASRDARIWLAGFLAGQEPDAGDLWTDVEDFLPDDRYDEWQAVCAEFRTTGQMPTRWLDERQRRIDEWLAEEDAKAGILDSDDNSSNDSDEDDDDDDER